MKKLIEAKKRLLTRYADICPVCREINTIILTRGYKQNNDHRIAYGKCKFCNSRITIREINKLQVQ